MITDQNGNTSIITQEKETIVELIKKLDVLYPKFKNNHIIVILTTLTNLFAEDIIEFLNLSNTHREAKHSFVIVTNTIDLDDIPDNIIVAPTLQEAYDIIEMEDMERDLGF